MIIFLVSLSSLVLMFELREYCIHDEMYLESGFNFCTPFKPHVTIISIQPQQGPPNKLVLTELYTLMY